jgi:surfactin synthase thioesterase subunit
MKIKVFFLPFAGGSKHSYHNFAKAAPGNLEIIPIELPGRGTRYKEPLFDNIHDLTVDVFEQIKNAITKSPYAIYGHSMGTLIGFLLTKKILANDLPPPLHLFVTGRGGPSVIYDDGPPAYLLNKAEFIEKVRSLGGSPDEILSDENMMDFFEPILRADFKAVATYIHQPAEPFNVPVTVIIGIKDKTTYDQAMLWQNETTKDIVFKKFPGKHFFIFDYTEHILNIIFNTLNNQNHEDRISLS